MKRLVISVTALTLLTGIAFAVPAEAARYRNHITPREHVAIAHSTKHVNAVKARARSDGHVSLWERMRIRMAEARHKLLVRRLWNN
jgi:hypothetical protein